MQTHAAAGWAAQIRGGLPPWICQDVCELTVITGARPGYRLEFRCCCSVKPVRVTANKPRACWTSTEATALVAKSVTSEHAGCQPATATAAPLEEPTQRELDLVSSCKKLKRKLTAANCQAEQSGAKAARSEQAVRAASNQKRQDSLAEARRVDIDPASQEVFTAANKSTALHVDSTGLVDTVKYWVQGAQL